MLAAITMECFVVTPGLPNAYALSDTEIGELIAKTVRGALESDRTVSADELADAFRTFLQHTQHVTALLSEQLQRERLTGAWPRC